MVTLLLHPHRDTYIFTNNPVSIYLLRNYKYSHATYKHQPKKHLLRIILTQITTHPAHILKIHSHTRINGHDIDDKLTNQHALVLVTLPDGNAIHT